MSQDFETLKARLEAKTLEANYYHYRLEAKNNASDALITLSGLIISLTRDLRSYQRKMGDSANIEAKWDVIKQLEGIADIFYPMWMQLDNSRTLLAQTSRKNVLLEQENLALKKRIADICQAHKEL